VSSLFARMREKVDFPAPFEPASTMIGGGASGDITFFVKAFRVGFHDVGTVTVGIFAALVNSGAKEFPPWSFDGPFHMVLKVGHNLPISSIPE